MRAIVTLILITSISVASAQQLPYYTHNIVNPFYVNSATAGDNGTNISFNYLDSWYGFSGSPKSYFVTFDAAVKKKMGIGVKLFSNINNIRRHSGIELSYAYKIKLFDNHNLKFGISGVTNQSAIDFNKIIAQDSDELSLLENSTINEVNYDANFSIAYNFQTFNFGFTANQLLGSAFTFEENIDDKQLLYRNVAHYFIYANYKHSFSNGKYNVGPNVSYRTIAGSYGIFNAGVLLSYKELVWANFGMNFNTATSFSIGYNLNEEYSIAYTYSSSSNSLNQYTSGSHEIMFKVKFKKDKSEPKLTNTDTNIDYELTEKVDFLKQENENLKEELEEQRKLLKNYIDGLEELKNKYHSSKETIDDIKEAQNEKKDTVLLEETESELNSDIKFKSHHGDNGKIDRNNNGVISFDELDNAIDEFNEGNTSFSKVDITEAIDNFLESGVKISKRKLDKLYEKLAQDKNEGKEINTGFVDEVDFGYKYIVVGGFQNIADAKKYQNIIQREYGVSTNVIENLEQTLFLVYTEKSKVSIDFNKKIKKLEQLDKKKIFVDKPWVYQRKL